MVKILKRIATTLCCLVSMIASSLPVNAIAAVPLGVYQGNGCDGVTRLSTFVEWFGRKPDFMVDFFASDSWESMYADAEWTISCWQKQNMKMVYSIPMLPASGATLAEGASGAYDDKFRALAQLLISRGYQDTIIRLGWEFNGGWYAWAAKKDPANWIKYWQRIVTVMRSVNGANFKFDWCSAQGYQQIPAPQLYPGDAYVDYIGRDMYNQSWNPAVTTPQQRWNDLLTEQYGLNWLREFAQAHSKPISFPEWGTGSRPDGHGGGDDAYFIARMAEWIRANNVAYHGYWDYPAQDYNARLSTGAQPAAAAAFLQAFRSIPKAPSGVTAKKNPS